MRPGLATGIDAGTRMLNKRSRLAKTAIRVNAEARNAAVAVVGDEQPLASSVKGQVARAIAA